MVKSAILLRAESTNQLSTTVR